MTVQDMSRSHRLTYARTHTLIIAANLCMDFEAATVGSVFDAFGQQLSPGFSSDDFDRWWDRGGNGPDVAELINRYVALSGHRLASHLTDAFERTDWRIARAPVEHSAFWDRILADWKQACADAYSELARIPAYSTNGLGQMELDVKHVVQSIKELVGEDSTLVQLLNEAIGAVHRRCLQRTD
ncbi:hypothetical protein BJ085DRAFT_28256 [Dimargaris cristalligena]|uniref:Uncharacterized protein n=1 Tax=Dimargaris cristalligena TaxID=215637 RepID=A0A4P9ZMB4_9FUNG|nr:hypothetical protein BJ085DRAFT_28256 [Dimargaris cristalligena]|eukprot:RKP33400.1 hypothetical protein BJ085DRAFT_28256 [Dimargaris cristalligena]